MCKIFVQVAGRVGRPRKYGEKARVMMPGATVAPETKRQNDKWRKVTKSAGILQDQLHGHAIKTKFRPSNP